MRVSGSHPRFGRQGHLAVELPQRIVVSSPWRSPSRQYWIRPDSGSCSRRNRGEMDGMCVISTAAALTEQRGLRHFFLIASRPAQARIIVGLVEASIRDSKRSVAFDGTPTKNYVCDEPFPPNPPPGRGQGNQSQKGSSCCR